MKFLHSLLAGIFLVIAWATSLGGIHSGATSTLRFNTTAATSATTSSRETPVNASTGSATTSSQPSGHIASSDFAWIPLSSARNSHYFINVDAVYFGDPSSPISWEQLQGADPGSFLILEMHDGTLPAIGKDENYVYVGNVAISNADPSTFVPLTDSSGNWNGFEIDRRHVYFGSSVLGGADPKTFTWLGIIAIHDLEAGQYAKDSKNVYFVDRGFDLPLPIQGADASTFHLLGIPEDGNVFVEQSCGHNCYFDAQDANHKYYLGTIVE